MPQTRDFSSKLIPLAQYLFARNPVSPGKKLGRKQCIRPQRFIPDSYRGKRLKFAKAIRRHQNRGHIGAMIVILDGLPSPLPTLVDFPAPPASRPGPYPHAPRPAPPLPPARWRISVDSIGTTGCSNKGQRERRRKEVKEFAAYKSQAKMHRLNQPKVYLISHKSTKVFTLVANSPLCANEFHPQHRVLWSANPRGLTCQTPTRSALTLVKKVIHHVPPTPPLIRQEYLGTTPGLVLNSMEHQSTHPKLKPEHRQTISLALRWI
ncbi:hypothetical protein C8F04DRAFT_1182075 [Mycena alexandri]|uniref:Uncharacterized protein n=1 Tax=Mycena alexandri TaxID=1745969 RepID=A0AAD6X525_9AGAR|nr:hypothetical protein C8F04DRAFT_1182075 [Mycena alexandri]